ncbi:MAG: hypothetical protein AAF682_12305 [Planctomycetota bacterium]
MDPPREPRAGAVGRGEQRGAQLGLVALARDPRGGLLRQPELDQDLPADARQAPAAAVGVGGVGREPRVALRKLDVLGGGGVGERAGSVAERAQELGPKEQQVEGLDAAAGQHAQAGGERVDRRAAAARGAQVQRLHVAVPRGAPRAAGVGAAREQRLLQPGGRAVGRREDRGGGPGRAGLGRTARGLERAIALGQRGRLGGELRLGLDREPLQRVRRRLARGFLERRPAGEGRGARAEER